jgi:hypothetical protein
MSLPTPDAPPTKIEGMALCLGLDMAKDDSPTYRSNLQRFEDEVDRLTQWLETLVKSTRSFTDELTSNRTFSLQFTSEFNDASALLAAKVMLPAPGSELIGVFGDMRRSSFAKIPIRALIRSEPLPMFCNAYRASSLKWCVLRLILDFDCDIAISVLRFTRLLFQADDLQENVLAPLQQFVKEDVKELRVRIVILRLIGRIRDATLSGRRIVMMLALRVSLACQSQKKPARYAKFVFCFSFQVETRMLFNCTICENSTFARRWNTRPKP